jgi:hypothetical protein
MSDAYNVRSNGQRYYVYRIDGNVQVAEYFNASEAQRDCATRNMRHNEQFGKKKELEPEATSQSTSDSDAGVQTRPYSVPQKKTQVPDPPPGQGASY